ncbi:MAG: hypothetical protein COA71_06910 [SAR86 cluster bacterium]|uniref:Phytase-like domain-containing protein n=1 Tax=SAR86 cluster bacterium TaxID=2030880 RepID=A0A2A5CED5_9GAMM|nr:hypothetical protein [Gammaproteobacteria bacterium AH-315-E17]PCJ41736.1 MAG: hypothetical protein COA71_06910 [SAR86 cluster bacterium]
MTSMKNTVKQKYHKSLFTKACAILLIVSIPVQAQQSDESFYQRFSPIELTGNWVSVITEDWHIRMISPPKGNFDGLPLSTRAQEAANAVDLEQLVRDGQACQAYGAARLLREPGRLRISWEDSDTLRIDTDAGEQTRLLHFDNIPAPGASSLQGLSIAEWQYAGGFDPVRTVLNPGQIGGRRLSRGSSLEMMGGKLYVETNNLSPSMLRKNGVPLSADTELKEYFNTLREPDGTEWLIVTTIVRDPLNLLVNHITSTNFQREPDNSKWNPTLCTLF